VVYVWYHTAQYQTQVKLYTRPYASCAAVCPEFEFAGTRAAVPSSGGSKYMYRVLEYLRDQLPTTGILEYLTILNCLLQGFHYSNF
jgi:hypothetical protein